MGTDINFNKSLGRTYGTYIGLPSVSYDPASIAYFTATGITGATQKSAIDNLVKGLKADGLWSKMKAVYPFVTDNRNLFSYTEDFSDAYWTKSALSITTNATTAPDGTLTADKAIPAASTGAHDLSKLLTRTSGSYTATISIYAKQAEDKYFCLSLQDAIGGLGITFDVSAGTVSTPTSTYGTGWSEVSNSITSVGNGWFRITYTATTTNATTQLTGLYRPGNIPNLFGGSTGNGVNGVFVWGTQLEAGSTATLYQPILTTQQSYISNQFKYNLVNPLDTDAAFRLTFAGGWTHASTGATPNGVNAYANTFLTPSVSLVDASLSYYSRTSTVENGTGDANGIVIGVREGAANNTLQLRVKSNPSNFNDFMYTKSGTSSNNLGRAVDSSGLGLFSGALDATSSKIYKNGVNITTSNLSYTRSTPALPLYIGSLNNKGVSAEYTLKESAFAHIGDTLNATEMANLYTRVQAYQTALNRQIP